MVLVGARNVPCFCSPSVLGTRVFLLAHKRARGRIGDCPAVLHMQVNARKREYMLIFFTKAPRIGFGKTRLSAILPAERCLHLARLLISDTFKVARHFEVVVYYDGKPADLEFLFSAHYSGGETGHLPAHTSAHGLVSDFGCVSERVPGHVPARSHVSGSGRVPGHVPACPSTQRPQLYPQHGATLGERMQHALFQQLSHHRKVILIGSDIVGLTPKLIDRAYKALDTHDIVITPTLDGGYGLIGMRKPCDVFSGMRFSQDDVARNTVKCARERGYSITMEGTLLDVDTLDDALRAETAARDVRCICLLYTSDAADDIL